MSICCDAIEEGLQPNCAVSSLQLAALACENHIGKFAANSAVNALFGGGLGCCGGKPPTFMFLHMNLPLLVPVLQARALQECTWLQPQQSHIN